MRKELYNAIKTRLAKDTAEVAHIDLWNHNVEFIEQEDGWDRPAVFVEIGTIEWSALHGGGHRGKGIVRLHVVTDWVEGGQEAAWDLCDEVRQAIEGLTGETFNGLTLVGTDTNHNHEDILESIDSYEVRYLLE